MEALHDSQEEFAVLEDFVKLLIPEESLDTAKRGSRYDLTKLKNVWITEVNTEDGENNRMFLLQEEREHLHKKLQEKAHIELDLKTQLKKLEELGGAARIQNYERRLEAVL